MHIFLIGSLRLDRKDGHNEDDIGFRSAIFTPILSIDLCALKNKK